MRKNTYYNKKDIESICRILKRLILIKTERRKIELNLQIYKKRRNMKLILIHKLNICSRSRKKDKNTNKDKDSYK